MHDARFVDAELDLAGLDFRHGLRHVRGDRAGLGVRHQATGPEDFAQLADGAHHVGRRHHGLEVDPAAGDAVDQFVAPHHVGAGIERVLLLVRTRNHHHPLRLAEAVRQHDRAAHHLIRVLGVDPQTDGECNGFVKLRELELLDERKRFVQCIRPVLDLLLCRRIFLAVSSHKRLTG